MKHKLTVALILSAMLMLMSGCGSKIDSTTIEVHKNGEVTHTIVEAFDTQGSSLTDLEAMIRSQIDAFAQSNPGAEITLESVESEGESGVKVVMTYEDVATFSNFNNAAVETPAVCFYGTVEDAYSAGIDVSSLSFAKVDSDETFTGDAVLSMGESTVFLYDNAMNNGQSVTVILPKKIAYYTDGVTVSGKNAVIGSGGGTTVCVIQK
ncbi:MAG: hypothetical protein K6G23_00425 [Lachnospiraceae bacterium]|nr:hypothetical protein [Lachnospiraceae bacterium]